MGTSPNRVQVYVSKYEPSVIHLERGRSRLDIPIAQAVRVADKIVDLVESRDA